MLQKCAAYRLQSVPTPKLHGETTARLWRTVISIASIQMVQRATQMPADRVLLGERDGSMQRTENVTMIDWLLTHNLVKEFGTDVVRLSIAVALGGVLGIERQLHGRWAGIRTHMMVSLGAAIFTIAAITTAPNDSNEVTRVIQGVAAGIGFLGAGTILKLSTELEVKGLTTASSIWLAAALGTVAGLGEFALAAAAGLMSLLVLAMLRPLTKAIGKGNDSNKETSGDCETV